jgi:high-affinity iron transporter
MISNYLIGLREGLEAALVVSILITYLVQTNRKDSIRYVWIGVLSAIGLSVLAGGILTATKTELEGAGEQIFAGLMSLTAVALVTWMIIWMRETSRKMTTELHGKLENALRTSAFMVSIMAFVAVAREGLETALFFFSSLNASGAENEPITLIGFVLGLVTAALIGLLLYRGAVRINLKKFFTWTSYFLIFVAAGVLTYAVHELQEAEILPGEHAYIFDVSSAVSVDSWFGAIAKGIFNFDPSTSLLQGILWVGYVGFAFWLFLKKAPTPSTKTSVPLKRPVNKSVVNQ